MDKYPKAARINASGVCVSLWITLYKFWEYLWTGERSIKRDVRWTVKPFAAQFVRVKLVVNVLFEDSSRTAAEALELIGDAGSSLRFQGFEALGRHF